MGLFKCWDLLEVITDPSTEPKTLNLTRFKLSKATEEITAIVEMQSKGKKIKVNVTYDNDNLKKAKF